MSHEGEHMGVTQAELLGAGAMGSIEPDPRIARGEITADRVDELTERLKGDEFFTQIDNEHGPNAAGGTFTLVVADALTSNRFRQNGENAKDHAKSLYGFLTENCDDDLHRKIIPRVCIDGRSGDDKNTSVIGGHDDEHGKAGCGAQKFLGPILGVIRDHGDAIQDFLAMRGVEVDDENETHNQIVGNAGLLLEQGYVVDGAELRQAYVETDGAGETSVTKLLGDHNEVVADLNGQKGTTLDRAKVREEYGDDYEVFNADLHVLPEATAVVSATTREAEQKNLAAHYYQVATTIYLAGQSLRLTDR